MTAGSPSAFPTVRLRISGVGGRRLHARCVGGPDAVVGVLQHDTGLGFHTQSLCCRQEKVGGRFALHAWLPRHDGIKVFFQAGGMVEEVRGLLDSGVPAERLLSYGLEYRYVTLYLLGELTYEEMRRKLAIEIHRFAKRQMTWCRGMERGGIKIHWTNV